MAFEYKPKGTCSTLIRLEVADGIVRSCSFKNGCRGNLQGISRLIEGMPVEQVIERCLGIRCKGDTSCPDQLAKALLAYQAGTL